MKTVFLRHSRVLVVYLQGLSLVACSSSGSMDSKGSGAKSPTTVAKSSADKGGESNESAEADMPQEIAGGFLTCSYVTPEESGFAQSDDFVPVGCGIQKNGEKITDPNLSYKIGLYSPSKSPDTMDTSPAPSSSQWHGYGNLPRANKTNHFLGMTVTDLQNNRPEETVYFAVKDLKSDSPGSMLNLVGSYESGGGFDMEKIMPEQLGPRLQEFLNFSNESTPILPAASCSQGMIRDEYDTRQFTNSLMTIAVFADEIQKITGSKSIQQNRTQKGPGKSIKPKNVKCFVLAKEANKDQWNTPIGTPKPVLEAEGCLFLQSPKGFVIYGQRDIAKYNIKKEYLERYVKANMCPDAK